MTKTPERLKHYERKAIDYGQQFRGGEDVECAEISRSCGFYHGFQAAIADLQSAEAIEHGKTHITTNRQTWVDWLEREED